LLERRRNLGRILAQPLDHSRVPKRRVAARRSFARTAPAPRTTGIVVVSSVQWLVYVDGLATLRPPQPADPSPKNRSRVKSV
jgi:hypothetical protein